MGRPVVHFEIMGEDGARLRAFYRALFDWEIDADNPHDYGVVATAEGGIGGGVGGVVDGQSPHVTVYVEVPDVEAALARVEQLGGRRLMGPEEIMPGLEIGMLHDPSGNLLGVLRRQG